MEVLEAIKTRRSIRKYKTTPIDDKVVEQVLEAARWAPSWKNTQCWRFIVVRSEALKTELANALSPDNSAIPAIKNAPVVIVACAALKQSGFHHGKEHTIRGDWYMFDVGLAMGNMVLAAHALGLGTVHIGAFDHKKVEILLNVPEGFCIVEMTPLGYADAEAHITPRKELTEIVFQEKFGSR
jgi:nitroreductase